MLKAIGSSTSVRQCLDRGETRAFDWKGLALGGLFLWLCHADLQAQVGRTPFVCDGDFYITMRSRQWSELFTIRIDPTTNAVAFNRLPRFDAGFDLNGMGYRSTDNFIYVIDQRDNTLARIDASGTVERLKTLQIPRHRYFSGACTPDGQYLVISGSPFDFGFGSANANLVFIDLTDPDYPTREVMLRGNEYLFFDLDFDPFTGICYAYDSNQRRLISIDPVTGETRPVGEPNQPSSSMGTLFFDAFGNLYGYGRPDGGNLQNTFFQIDIRTGTIRARARGEDADRSDGCSCPFTIRLEKDVFPRETAPCAEVVYSFRIANASATGRAGISISDMMPEGMEILEIIRNPFGGDVIDTGNPRELRINDMFVPLGIDSLLVRVRIGRDMAGQYKNQARLDGLPEFLGGYSFSDDPLTPALGDSTSLWVEPLIVDLNAQNRLVCPGDVLTLRAGQEGVQFLWNDGSTEPTLTVSAPGTYWVEARTICDVRFDTVAVAFAPELLLDAGADIEISLGDTLTLMANVSGLGPFDHRWAPIDESTYLDCADCAVSRAVPFFSTRFEHRVIDAAGCEMLDTLLVLVDRNAYVWIPNAFTPNFDKVNDFFYVQGKVPYHIESFGIYNRWGQRLWENRDIKVNSAPDGWDGWSLGRLMNPGVYVYKVVLSFVDGSQELLSGDVLLLE